MSVVDHLNAVLELDNDNSSPPPPPPPLSLSLSLSLAGVSLGLSQSTTSFVRTSSISEDEGETVRVCLNTNMGPPNTVSTLGVQSEDGTATGIHVAI